MKQVLQNFKSGELLVEEVPAPTAPAGGVLVANHFSLISTGTEGGTVKLGQMSLLGKARARPEQVAKVLNLVRSDGIYAAYQAVTRSLDMPIALGYCCSGVVVAVGEGAGEFKVGDLVACGGLTANHAEIVAIPRNLCIALPAGLPPRFGAFTTLGSIAMQAVRVADVRVGEKVAVIGLGLVGLLVVQILQAAGCEVLGIDVSGSRVQYALEKGWCSQAASRDEPNLLERVKSFTGGYGVDSVIITAAAPSNDPVALAGELSRFKGKVVVVGRTEMTAPRETYLFKELELRTSLAYGPGTGDASYELQGQDYPIGYVRWTENRNMSAFAQLVARGAVALEPMVSHVFDIAQAQQAFDVVTGKTGQGSLAVLLRYPQAEQAEAQAGPGAAERITIAGKVHSAPATATSVLGIGVIGAGSFATNVMVPILAREKLARLRGIASAHGVRAQALGKKYGFAYCGGDAQAVLEDPDTHCVFILTRHDTHADLTLRALAAGKHVFVEKPLAMHAHELDAIAAAARASGKQVLTGFNRRYSSLAQTLAAYYAGRSQPLAMHFRGNVGYRPPEHWLHDPAQGGGVILGEACHFIDFCVFLCAAAPTVVSAQSLTGDGRSLISEDNVQMAISFADGSQAIVSYFSNGDPALSRERVEVHGEGASCVLEEFRQLTYSRGGKRQRHKRYLGADRGHAQQVRQYLSALAAGRESPTPLTQQLWSMAATLACLQSLRLGQPVVLPPMPEGETSP